MADKASRRRNTTLIVIMVAIGVLLLCCCALVAAGAVLFPWMGERRGLITIPEVPSGGGVEVTREVDQAFRVEGDVVLDVRNQVGDITIEGTDDGQVVVEALVRAFGATTTDAERTADEVEVIVEQGADNHFRVIGRFRQGLEFRGRSPTVRFMIRVPRQAAIMAVSRVGRVEVSNVVGSADITSDVGDVILREFTMRGDTRIEVSVGRILVELPKDAAFVLDAQSRVGDIDTEFDVRGAAPQRVPPGDRMQGEVGEDPQAELWLRTNTGDITIAMD